MQLLDPIAKPTIKRRFVVTQARVRDPIAKPMIKRRVVGGWSRGFLIQRLGLMLVQKIQSLPPYDPENVKSLRQEFLYV